MASILSLPFRLAHNVITFLYPLYASYKAISPQEGTRTVNRPPGGSNQRTEMADLETWLMYWSVVGAMTFVEAWAEWTWSWLPFYHVFKLAFTLWLVLPQTQGATILYSRYLGPFLQSHEDDIDVALSSAKVQATRAAANGFAALWQRLRGAILGAATTVDPTAAPQHQDGRPTPVTPQHPIPAVPPTMHDPASGPANQLFGMLKHYGPLAAAGIVSVMDRAAAAAAEASEKAKAEGSGAAVSSKDIHDGEDEDDDSDAVGGNAAGSAARTRRRAELERQLAAEMDTGSTSQVKTRASAAAASSSSRLRAAKPTNAGSDLSSDEGSGRSAKDLSGSYQLVDQEDEPEKKSDVSGADTSRSGGGWTSWMSRR